MALHPTAHLPALAAVARARIAPDLGVSIPKIRQNPALRILTITYLAMLSEHLQTQIQHEFTAQTGWYLVFVMR